MPELKLARLPDRKPVKITINVSATLDKKLHSYAEAYRAAYGEEEKVSELIPFILDQFLDGDRGFAKARREKDTGERWPDKRDFVANRSQAARQPIINCKLRRTSCR